MANPFAFTNGDTKGGVPDPLAAPATSYLAANASFKSLPLLTDVPNQNIMLGYFIILPVGGVQNTGIGSGALSALVGGSANNAFGASALEACTTGGNNVGIGDNSLLNVTIGAEHTAIGQTAGSAQIGGLACTFVGAFVDTLAPNAVDSTAIGGANVAGTAATITKSNQIVIGGSTILEIKLALNGVPIFANNAAAVGGGLSIGALYRSGADPDVLAIVH